MAAPDKTNNLLLTLGLIAAVVVTVVMVVGVIQLFNGVVNEEIQRKVLGVQNSQLRSLRADEDAKLTTYQWVSQSGGVVRIPVQRAAELTLRDWKSRPGAK